MSVLDKDMQEVKELLRGISWGQIYNSTIANSDWLLDKAVSPGRWAVGYEFLYVLYRVLNDVHPDSILELGLGQSSKLTAQYAKHRGIPHTIIEHDIDWIKFFTSSWNSFSRNTVVHVLPLTECHKNGDPYYEYQGFGSLIDGKKYSLISVDGPFGGDGAASRRDVVKYLPQILADDFVILFDDCGRVGEHNTVMETLAVLKAHSVDCVVGLYNGGGYKQTYVVACSSWKWLTTL